MIFWWHSDDIIWLSANSIGKHKSEFGETQKMWCLLGWMLIDLKFLVWILNFVDLESKSETQNGPLITVFPFNDAYKKTRF